MILAMHRERGSPWARRKVTEQAEAHRRSLEAAMRTGIPIAMGTDAGSYCHGYNAVELRLLVIDRDPLLDIGVLDRLERISLAMDEGGAEVIRRGV